MSELASAPAFSTTNETLGGLAPPPATQSPPPESNSSPPPISFPSPPTPSSNSTSHPPIAQGPPPDSKSSPPLISPPPSPTSSSGSNPSHPPPDKSPSPPPPPSNEPPPSAAPPPSPPPPSPPPHYPVHPPTLPLTPPSTNNQSSSPPNLLPPTSKVSPPPPSTPVIVSPSPNSVPATPSLPELSPPTQVVIPPLPKTPPGTPPSPPLPLSPPITPTTNPPNQATPTKPSPSISSDSNSPKSSPSSRHVDSSSSTPSSSSGSSHSTVSYGNVAIVVVAGVLAVVAVVAFVAIFFVISGKKRRKNELESQYRPPPSNFSIEPNGQYHRQANTTGHSSNSDIYYASKPPSSSSATGNSYGSYRGHMDHSGFTYEELIDMTNGFSLENLIGEGGFGCVYKGCQSDGRTVAVKQLKVGSGQGDKEFTAEVEIISRVHHRHLVSLVGYCISEHHRLLVYEFLPNKTLEHHLHGKGLLAMDWPKRLKIAIGSARGLAYLHEDCHPRIIHRDIKSANILLDNSFEAQVADFGLAKLTNDAHTHVSTRVMGTFGYMAPEYALSGKLTDRSDVFSFGVVLLELITGRKPVDPSQPLGDQSLVEWARPLLVRALEIGDCEELVDPRLENNYARSEMLRMVEVATACVRHSGPKRPRMVQVLRALDSEGDMSDLSNGVKYGQSMVYDSSQYSMDIQNFRRTAFGSEEYSSDCTNSGSTAFSGYSQSKEAPYTLLDPGRPREQISGEYNSSHGSTNGR